MLRNIRELDNEYVYIILKDLRELLVILMGKHPENIAFESMLLFGDVSSTHMSAMYKRVTSSIFYILIPGF